MKMTTKKIGHLEFDTFDEADDDFVASCLLNGFEWNKKRTYSEVLRHGVQHTQCVNAQVVDNNPAVTQVLTCWKKCTSDYIPLIGKKLKKTLDEDGWIQIPSQREAKSVNLKDTSSTKPDCEDYTPVGSLYPRQKKKLRCQL